MELSLLRAQMNNYGAKWEAREQRGEQQWGKEEGTE